MPTYEYRCEDCGHDFTALLSIADHEKTRARCPKCKSHNVQPVYAGVSVQTSKKS